MSKGEVSLTGEAESQVDPAKYIFEHPEYHDWCVTVEDLSSSTTESVGVASCYLLSQSSFFRKMVETNKLKDKNNIKIMNVSAEVFKLVLTFVYGGKLPDMHRSTAAQLALAANVYNISPLIKKASKYLIPTAVQDVFPALWIVASISSPVLEPHVTKIIQEETKDLTACKEFLELGSECLEFIAKQEKLSLNELDLWKQLVKWGQYKVLSDPSKTLREHLQNTLQYVRLTTFSQEEIVKEVMPTKILTAAEVMDLLSAVASNQPWEIPGFCNTQTAREISEEKPRQSKESSQSDMATTKESLLFEESKSFTPESIVYNGYKYQTKEQTDYVTSSNLTVKTIKAIEIESFVFQSKSIMKLGFPSVYKLSCSVTVSKIVNGFCKDTRIVQAGGSVVGDAVIAFPLKLRTGQALILEANTWYNVDLEFNNPHPVFTISCHNYGDKTYVESKSGEDMSVKYNTPLHVKKINYKV